MTTNVTDPKTLKDMPMPELLIRHNNLATELADTKKKEMAIRVEICDRLLEGKNVGAHKFNIDDFTISATKKITHSLDQDMIGEMIDSDELSEDELGAIKIKYDLALGVYKKLDNADYLDEALTVKPATPALKVSYTGEL